MVFRAWPSETRAPMFRSPKTTSTAASSLATATARRTKLRKVAKIGNRPQRLIPFEIPFGKRIEGGDKRLPRAA